MKPRSVFVVNGHLDQTANDAGSLLDAEQIEILSRFTRAAFDNRFPKGPHQPGSWEDWRRGLDALRRGGEIVTLAWARPSDADKLHPVTQAAVAAGHTLVTVVLVREGPISGPMAMGFVAAGASCVIDWNMAGSEFSGLLIDALTEPVPFTMFHHVEPAKRNGFVVTPLRETALQEDFQAIRAGLEAAGFRAVRADRRMQTHDLQGNVCRLIDECDFAIVNLKEYGEGRNANVYWEYGFARGRNKPVILIHQAGFKPPADIQGDLRPIEYRTPAELAQKLYFGLKHLAGIEPSA